MEIRKTLLIFVSVLLIFKSNVKAQITEDTVISPLGIGFDFYTVQISKNETKYLFADTLTNTFSLYNMDFSPFMTNISVPEPFDNFTFQVMYVTRYLFDCDSSNIEYVYASTTDNTKPFRIVRTDGTILFKVDSAIAPFCTGGCLGYSDIIVPIRNTSAGTKLFLNKYDSTGRQQIHIYSLCGALPTSVFDISMFQQPAVKIFPNPTAGQLNFQINLPNNVNDYELVILDSNAKVIKRESIGAVKTRYSIDVSNFSSGTYFYSICTKNNTYKSGKFILSR